MKIWRFLPLLFCVFSVCAKVAFSQPTISGRKIRAIEAINLDHMIVSPNNRWLAFGWSEEGTGIQCSLLNRRTHEFWTPDIQMQPIAFSRDGRRLFVWCNEEHLPGLKRQSKNDTYIAVYNPARRCFSRIFPDVRAPDNLDYMDSGVVSKDGRTLTVASQKKWIHAFDTRTGKLKWRNCLPQVSEDEENPILSQDGKRSLQCSNDLTAQQSQVFDTRTGKVLSRLRLPSQAMRPFDPQGRIAPRGPMAALFYLDTQEWVFWNIHTNRVCWKLGTTQEQDVEWRFSPDGRTIAVFGSRGVEVRDAMNGHTYESNPDIKASNIAFSPNGKCLYAISDGNNFEGGQVLWQWRVFGTKRQFLADARVMNVMARREKQFALSPSHINESLIIAARRGDPKRIAFLLAHGANIETRDSHSKTPLGIVAGRNIEDDGPEQYFACARLLIAHGANIKVRDVEGDTPLTLSLTQDPQITQLLLSHGAKHEQKALDDALLGIAAVPEPDLVERLITYGANANARDSEGNTPIMAATNWGWAYGVMDKGDENNAISMVKSLLAHGANINAHNKAGHTALKEAYDPAIKNALKRLGAKP